MPAVAIRNTRQDRSVRTARGRALARDDAGLVRLHLAYQARLAAARAADPGGSGSP